MFESLLHINLLLSPVDAGGGRNGSIKEKHVTRNDEELTDKKRDLEDSNQELRASNQELRASNQELRASNQELRASNQQYKTSHQDLAALNHDLIASNQSLIVSNQDLSASNQDLKRLNHELAATRRIAFNLLEDAQITESQLATDLANMRLLIDLSEKLISENNIQENFNHILNAGIAITKANAGTIQILNEKTQQLEMTVSKGFNKTFISCFEFVDANSNTSCGMALKTNERVFIDYDVPAEKDPGGSLRMHVEQGFFSAQSTPLIGHSGKAIGVITTHFNKNHRPNKRALYFIDFLVRQAADMVERKKAEEALRKSEEQLKHLNLFLEEQVMSRTAELKNFNNVAANNYAETLRHVYINLETIVTNDARNLSNSSRANIRRAQAAVQKMKLLTNDINNYLELYDHVIKKEIINPNTILIEVREKMQKRLEDANATISADHFPLLFADPGLLSKLLHHIIDNSVKFRKPETDPLIDIHFSLIAANTNPKAEENTAYTVLVIADNGIGFNDDDAEKIFDLFTQLDAGKHKGSGIGLAICKKIMEMHGGFITAESKPGEGTAIHCYFPA